MKRFTKNLGPMVILFFMCFFCMGLVFYSDAKEAWTMFRRKQELPRVEAKFNALADDLPHSESDTVLTTLNAAHHLVLKRGIQWGLGCITGSTIIIYGSIRDFEAVVSEYETLLADREAWTGGADLDSDYRSYSHKSGKAVFDINFYVSSDFDYPPECAGYPTCYATKLLYGDPSLLYCFG
jgi:hypothetical protein